jgi:DNA processing protein
LNELEALLLLNRIPLIGSVKIRLLIELYGSAQAALQAPLTEMAALPGFGPKILQAWQKGVQEVTWEQDIEWVERCKAQVIPFTHANYPKRLLEIADFPLILYVKGTLKPDYRRCIAVVGTRQASHYGMEMAQRLSGDLAAAGWTVVSGLARGIDTAAHQGALEKGQTWAVLGSGLASIYPKENERLATAISEQGAVLSEFPMLTPPDRPHFPQRNRIVSGLSIATVLIEAPEQSGAMLTVERAIHQRRLIFALPGRADQENFKGNHRLIKEQKAQLIENAQDILAVIDPQAFNFQFQPTQAPLIALEKEEEELLKRLPATEELSIEEIVQRLQWPVAKLNVLLMSLVLKKVIKEYPGKIYKKVYRNN